VKREYINFSETVLNSKEFSSFDIVHSWSSLLIDTGKSYNSFKPPRFIRYFFEKIKH
ncbi:16201_t:CDS:2, partial [Gigaspora margarita]